MSVPLLHCREVMPYLSAYVDGELDAQLFEQVETHLATCLKCGREVARYRAIDGLLLSLPASTPSPEVLDRILARTSSQNKEKAVRESLRRPGRVLAPRLVPTFLAADTNLAAPVPWLQPRRGRRPSWILASGLPTLAAVLIITMTLVFFHVRTSSSPGAITPTPTTNIQEVTESKVDTLAPRLSFTPAMPTFYPPVTGLKSTTIGMFPGGIKYLDVVWTLHAPLTTLHLREVGVPLADRVQYDYYQKSPNPSLTWTLSKSHWQPMGDKTGNTSRLIVGAGFGDFSVTLDIGVRGGNSSLLTPTSSTRNLTATEVSTLRLMSLSLSPNVTYQALKSVFPPNNGSVVHYQVLTTGVSNGNPYTWDVYQSSSGGLSAATLYDGSSTSSTELYTDYTNGVEWTRCYPGPRCVSLLSPPGDPFQLGNKASNFLMYGINSDIDDGELWNLGLFPAPSQLGIGQKLVYELAYVSGPYPLTVYVSEQGTQVVGVISQVDSQYDAPGGPGAASPLAVAAASLGNCSQAVAYPVIAYLLSNSPAIPSLTAPERPSGIDQNPSIATCQQF